jgi:hypothetical protein
MWQDSSGVEQRTHKPKVGSSNLPPATISLNELRESREMGQGTGSQLVPLRMERVARGGWAYLACFFSLCVQDNGMEDDCREPPSPTWTESLPSIIEDIRS